MFSILVISLLSSYLVAGHTVDAPAWDQEIDIIDFSQMELHSTFQTWMQAFDKKYDSKDEEYSRFVIFIDNLGRISQWNSDLSHSSRLRANQFADQSNEEFIAEYLFTERRSSKWSEDSDGMVLVDMPHENPTSVDWTQEGVVPPVKDMGQCDSSGVLSALSAMECNSAIAYGKEKLVTLSEQEIFDCCTEYGIIQCHEGLPDEVYKCVVDKLHGVCSVDTYPLRPEGTCKSDQCEALDVIASYTDVTKDDSVALETAVASGCVTALVEADQYAFQFYSSGIIQAPCGTNLDHAILIVGYGADSSGEEYWKIQNSWGSSWGMDGYALLCKNCNANDGAGECGILEDSSYPIPQ